MENDRIIIRFIINRKNGKREEKDLDIPLSINVNELILALNKTYNLGIDVENIYNCYLTSEYPMALLRGNKPLNEYGLMNGANIIYSERENQ